MCLLHCPLQRSYLNQFFKAIFTLIIQKYIDIYGYSYKKLIVISTFQTVSHISLKQKRMIYYRRRMNRSMKYWKYTSGGMGGKKKYVKLCNALHEMETLKKKHRHYVYIVFGNYLKCVLA